MGVIRRGLVIFLLASACACGPGGADGFGRTRCPIVNGTPADEAHHGAVVALIVDGIGYCSGTLVTPDVVLTAAHCIEGYGTVSVVFGEYATAGMGEEVETSGRWIHPQHGVQKFWNDIALLRLEREAPAGVQPIPALPQSLRLGEEDIGVELEFVGYGSTNPASYTFGTRLHAFGDLDLVCEDPAGCRSPVLNDTVPHKAFCHDQDPSGTCFGDSGGPALVEREGQLYVAGVTSFTSANCDVIACSAKVDEYEEAIRAFTGQAEGESCQAGSECASGFCVAGVCCDRVCDGPCEACNLEHAWGRCSRLGDGTSCSDGDPCNGIELCKTGQCQPGPPPGCDDDDPCTLDACVPGTGCAHTPAPDGTPCPDGDACNGEEICGAGACLPGEPRDCEGGGGEEPTGPGGIVGSGCSSGGPGTVLLPWLVLLVARRRP
jgi:uncharacterized protein (TIGR03382 family)